MTRGLINKIRSIVSLLDRDVRDLFKVGGRTVDDEFLKELRSRLQRAGFDQIASEWVIDVVRSAYLGRIVQGDEVLQLIRMRAKTASE